jgi:predicted nucleotidyltransferase
MLEKTVRMKIEQQLSCHMEIAFAYLHGSILHATNPNDIDIALYIFPEQFDNLMKGSSLFDYSIPFEQELEKHIGQSCDIQILNTAPLPFRARVVTQGIAILDRSPSLREQFELLSRVEYFDFRPRRERYLKEALV